MYKNLDKILDDIALIDRESFLTYWNRDSLEGIIKQENSSLLVDNSKAPKAFLIVLDMYDAYEIIRVATAKESRRKGLAKTLIESFIDKSDKDIFLEVRINNLSAIKLYEKLGFNQIGRRKAYYRDTGEDALIYKYVKGE